MPTTHYLKPILSFLDDLDRHNDRVWFNEHRPVYDAARNIFEQFVDDIIDEFRVTDNLAGLSAKNCIPRIYRDVRFSKDKSPYKTNMGAMITPGGWGSSWLGYYVSIQPSGQSMVAGGLYNPNLEQLNRFRQAIDKDATKFKRIVSASGFIEQVGCIEGDRLKTAPKGYDKAHPEIEILQLKQVIAIHRFSDEDVLASGFARDVVTRCRALRPFLDYLTDVLN